MSDDFDWSDEGSVVVHRQDAIAIYTNPDNNLVIREQRWPDDDTFIVIDRRFARAVIEAMERVLRETSPATQF